MVASRTHDHAFADQGARGPSGLPGGADASATASGWGPVGVLKGVRIGAGCVVSPQRVTCTAGAVAAGIRQDHWLAP
jgi:hypothetical protein